MRQVKSILDKVKNWHFYVFCMYVYIISILSGSRCGDLKVSLSSSLVVIQSHVGVISTFSTAPSNAKRVITFLPYINWYGNLWVVAIVKSWVNLLTWLLIGCLLLYSQSGASSCLLTQLLTLTTTQKFPPLGAHELDQHLQGLRAQVHAGRVGEVLVDVLEGPSRSENPQFF